MTILEEPIFTVTSDKSNSIDAWYLGYGGLGDEFYIRYVWNDKKPRSYRVPTGDERLSVESYYGQGRGGISDLKQKLKARAAGQATSRNRGANY